jgi:uncharacterized Zn finger protein (UPF0148 family)
MVEKICPSCGSVFQTKPGYKIRFCSTICGQRSAVKRAESSERMSRDNPMKRESVRDAVSKASMGIDRFKEKRGGNGKGPTRAEISLANVGKFVPNHIVPTGHCRDGSGYPTHYKLDLAWPLEKVAVEVDGPSHKALKIQESDRRKESFLVSLGWKVFRVSNEEALLRPESALERIRLGCGFTI